MYTLTFALLPCLSGFKNRGQRIPKGDVDSPWTHDLYEPGSLSARLTDKPTAPKINLNAITQKALRDATASSNPSQLSIKGAGSAAKGNVVEVGGLVPGTTAEDVAAIFKRCGEITSSKSVSGDDDVCIRLTFKIPTSATAAVQKFNNQPADGKVLSVRIVGSTTAGTTLGGRLGGADGLGLVREEGSVDVLMDLDGPSNSLVFLPTAKFLNLSFFLCQKNALRFAITRRPSCSNSAGSAWR